MTHLLISIEPAKLHAAFVANAPASHWPAFWAHVKALMVVRAEDGQPDPLDAIPVPRPRPPGRPRGRSVTMNRRKS